MRERWLGVGRPTYVVLRNLLFTSGILLLLLQFGCSNPEVDWQKAKQANTIAAYNAFIAKHTTSPHAAEAKQLIIKIEDDRSWEAALKDNSFLAVKQYMQSHPNGDHLSGIAMKGKQVCIDSKDNPQLCFVLREFDTYRNSVFPEHEGHGALVLDIIPTNGKIQAQLELGTVVEKTADGMVPGLLAFRLIQLDNAEYKIRNISDDLLTHFMVDKDTIIGSTTIPYGNQTIGIKDQSKFLIEGNGKSEISIALILRSKYDEINGLTVFGVPCIMSR